MKGVLHTFVLNDAATTLRWNNSQLTGKIKQEKAHIETYCGIRHYNSILQVFIDLKTTDNRNMTF